MTTSKTNRKVAKKKGPPKKKKAAKRAPRAASARQPKKVPKKAKARKVTDGPIKPVGGGFSRPAVEDVVHQINMAYGKSGPVIQKASDTWNTFDLRRPSGIMSLDLSTGGGLPSCGLSQLDGPEGVGKNFLLYHYMAECQRIYGDKACIGMASLETPMDKHFAQRCGVRIAMSPYDIDVENRARQRRGQPPMDSAEIKEARTMPDVGQFLVLDQGGAENIMNSIIDLVGHNICQIIGIDSWDAVQTYLEREKQLGEHAQRASVAQLQSFFAKKLSDEGLPAIYRCKECGFSPLESNVTDVAARKYYWRCGSCSWRGLDPAVERNETTLIAIRQVRSRMSTFGKGRPYQSAGAHAIRHQNLVRVTVHPGSRIPEDTSKPKLGKEVSWEVTKGKCGCHEGARGSFKLYFENMQVDVFDDLISQCLQQGIMGQGGGVYSVPFMEFKIKGRDNLLRVLEETPELWDQLRDRLYVETGLAHVRLR